VSELNAARRDRDEGVEAVLAADVAVHRDARNRIEDKLGFWARTGEPFTADHVDKLVSADGQGAYNRLVLASVMRVWAARGDIVEVFDRRPVQSSRRSRHGGYLRWWRGVAAEGEVAA